MPRRLAAAVVAAALLAAGCGDGANTSLDQALWPSPDEPTADPERAARSFVADYIGLADPQLGRFTERDPETGEVDVFRTGEDGRRLDAVIATVTLRRLDGDDWYVTSAESPEVRLTAPEPLAEIASPVTVSGRGRGFEGNVVVQLRRAFSLGPLAEEAVIAGAMAELEPFSAELVFEDAGDGTGAVVATTGSGIAAVDGFAAFPVRLGG